MKYFYVFLLSLLCTLPASAQIGEPRSTIAIGVSGGVAINRIGFDPTIKQNWHLGQSVGFVARFTSEKYFKALCALQLEVNYTTLGWTENVLDANSEPLPDTYRRDIYYIQIPAFARLGWGREHRGLQGYFMAGPQVGFCIGEKTTQSQFTLDTDGNPDRPNNFYSQYGMSVEKKFDYGIAGGLGVELSTRAGHFLLDGRYYYGLSDIFKNSKKDVFSRSNNGAIVVRLTYLFDVRK